MITEIQTPNGSVEIYEPTTEMIERLKSVLPYGLMLLDQPLDGAEFGIVMQCGDKELSCMRIKPLECEYDLAVELFNAHNYLIISSYCKYIHKGFSGAYLASSYLNQRDNNQWEAGVANFIFPYEISSESKRWRKIFSKKQLLDDQYGQGATKMFDEFIKSFTEEHTNLDLAQFFGKYIGIGTRPRSHLQGLAMWFMVLDSEIICLRANLREQEDSTWGFLAQQGITRVYHLPAAPMTIEESDLNSAKGISKLPK